MAEETPKPAAPTLDLQLYTLVGNIASDWATLEYMVNDCIWNAAKVDDQLGACITAKIFSLPPRLEALVLLLRARGASDKLTAKLNAFIQNSRRPTEARNRAVHDPLGVAHDDGRPQQLQITAQGKLVFQRRDVDPMELIKDRDMISQFLERFIALRNEIKAELATLTYTPQPLFPQISRNPG